ARAGLIDLGRISTENLEYIRLYQANSNDWVLPARSFASANMLVMATSSSRNLQENLNRLSYKQGSFGLINPSGNFSRVLSRHASIALNASYQKAHGRYNFDQYGQPGKSKRLNSDVEQVRIELDLPVTLRDSSSLKTKLYFYNSQRGLPGSILLFNESANERLDNTHLFGQLTWRKDLAKKIRVLLGAKTLFDRQKYVDPDFLNNEGFLENDFYQWEHYLSAAVGYRISGNLRASFSSDYFVNVLRRKDPFSEGFADPVRKNILNNLSLTFTNNRLEASANVLHTTLLQEVSNGEAGSDLRRLAPAFSLSFQPLKTFPLRLRTFYKEVFRAPTLDDMYYTFVGNTSLKPENSSQYNIGLTWHSRNMSGFFRQLVFTADHYYIRVSNKIVALPRNNLFQWSMMNIGKVQTRSFDLSFESDMHLRKQIQLKANFTYSLQDVYDVSDPSSPSYKRQVAYIPRHSGSARLMASKGKYTISWNTLFSSDRYRVGEQISENLVAGYHTHDVHLQYSLATAPRWSYKLIVELNNLLGEQYDIVKYFPMPGFNWRVGLIVDHKKNKK
ncbi:MAG: TonB-dependent receptor plug domain-containing protein, partial [Flavitalea sp.]